MNARRRLKHKGKSLDQWIAAKLMNQKLLLSVARHLLGALGMYLAGKGIIDAETAEAVIGFLLAAAAHLWSFFAPSKATALEPTKVRLVGLARHLLSNFAGLNLAMGWIPQDVFSYLVSAVPGLLAVLLSVKAPEKMGLTH